VGNSKRIFCSVNCSVKQTDNFFFSVHDFLRESLQAGASKRSFGNGYAYLAKGMPGNGYAASLETAQKSPYFLSCFTLVYARRSSGEPDN